MLNNHWTVNRHVLNKNYTRKRNTENITPDLTREKYASDVKTPATRKT